METTKDDSSFLRALGPALAAGALGGLLLYGLEAVDRLLTLRASLAGPGEAILYALYLSPVVWMCALAGLAIGLVVVAAGGASRMGAVLLARVVPRHAKLAGAVAAALAIGIGVRLASLAAPHLVEQPVLAVLKKVHNRVYELPFLVDNFGVLLTAGLVAAAAILIGLEWALSARPRGIVRILAAVAAAALAAILVGLFRVESTIFYGRYELTMHLPAFAVMLALAFGAAGLVLVSLSTGAWRRRAAVAGAIAVGASVLASGFVAWHMGANQNVKTLLWRRSIVARRAYQTAMWLADRDGDGASAWLDGGDLDDTDASVHPMAPEVPGNGVDDNCIGGDGPDAAIQTVALQTPAAPPAAPGTATNFVLISIDTLRANRMSAYGYERPTSPRLAEWGARGTLFERAYCQGSNTGLSFASMQRSATRAAVFDKKRPTMFGLLEDAGYATAFINARRDNKWLETKRWTRYRKVILDGVSHIDHTEGEQLWDADAVTDRTIAYLSALPADARHATWVHYLDPHEPRQKMAPFDFGDTASDKYDSEVAFADREVGRLLDWLRDSGRLANTVVVLVADHGESFLDHGMDLHGNRPYDEQIHVPMMMWAPDVAPARVAEPTGVLDIAPSVLAYLGLPAIPGAEGRDVLRSPVVARPIVAETPINLVEVSFHAFGVTDGRWRYIWDVRGNTVELYDLAADPSELHNLVDSQPERAAELRAVMARWLDATRPPRRGAASDSAIDD